MGRAGGGDQEEGGPRKHWKAACVPVLGFSSALGAKAPNPAITAVGLRLGPASSCSVQIRGLSEDPQPPDPCQGHQARSSSPAGLH